MTQKTPPNRPTDRRPRRTPSSSRPPSRSRPQNDSPPPPSPPRYSKSGKPTSRTVRWHKEGFGQPAQAENARRTDKPRRAYDDRPRAPRAPRGERPYGARDDRPRAPRAPRGERPYGARGEQTRPPRWRNEGDDRPARRPQKRFSQRPPYRAEERNADKPYPPRKRTFTARPPRRDDTRQNRPENKTDRAGRDDRPPARAPRYNKVGAKKPSKPAAHPAPAPDSEKVQKILADTGMGSRRQMETLLTEGRVQINGKTVPLGARATPADKIKVDGKLLTRADHEHHLLLYYKPIGKIVSREEVSDTVFADLPPAPGGRWMNLGRLDVNSEGLLLFSTDGDWVSRMTHPKYGIEREYRARASGVLPAETLAAACKEGLRIDNKHLIQPSRFTLEREGEGVNCWYRIVLTEGRNRAVRRIFEHYGLQVSRLIRTRFGDYTLPPALHPGDWKKLPLEK